MIRIVPFLRMYQWPPVLPAPTGGKWVAGDGVPAASQFLSPAIARHFLSNRWFAR
jgi:hypothetical protein